MKVRVLLQRGLSDGSEYGQIVDLPDEHAKVLIVTGAVEVVDDQSPDDRTASDQPSRRRYRRRDLTADD